ncbi:MAG: hypothetical protein ACYDEX_18090 [Mobilitalea sp.]
MYFKKTISKYLIILTIVILTYVGYLCINSSIYYEGISLETKEKITASIGECKGELPNLQTDSVKARWNDEAHDTQKKMMDEVLDSLTVLGESKKGTPNQYIVASYHDNVYIYIAYNEIASYKKIIIENNGHYYVSTADKGAISAIVHYMNENIIKFQR